MFGFAIFTSIILFLSRSYCDDKIYFENSSGQPQLPYYKQLTPSQIYPNFYYSTVLPTLYEKQNDIVEIFPKQRFGLSNTEDFYVWPMSVSDRNPSQKSTTPSQTSTTPSQTSTTNSQKQNGVLQVPNKQTSGSSQIVNNSEVFLSSSGNTNVQISNSNGHTQYDTTTVLHKPPSQTVNNHEWKIPYSEGTILETTSTTNDHTPSEIPFIQHAVVQSPQIQNGLSQQNINNNNRIPAHVSPVHQNLQTQNNFQPVQNNKPQIVITQKPQIQDNFNQQTQNSGSSVVQPVLESQNEVILQPNSDFSISRGINKLGLNLDKVLTPLDYDNVALSPLSLTYALAMLLLGASGKTASELYNLFSVNYETRREMDFKITALHEELKSMMTILKNNSATKKVEVELATALFPSQTYKIKQSYIDAAQKTYSSEVVTLDYLQHGREAMNKINNWVSSKTHGRINFLLVDPPSAETKLILVSALYFNGEWEQPFTPKSVKRSDFFTGKIINNKLETVNVDIMAKMGIVPYFNDKIRKCEIVGIPYKGNETYMYIVLPKAEPDKYNIKEFVNSLTENDLHDMISSTQIKEVTYAIPKMKVESNFDLTYALYSLGLNSLYTPSTADLHNIADGLFVNQVIHKVEIEVNERGTTASAATMIIGNRIGMPVVRADKPFLFFIYNAPMKAVLFWARVSRPTPNYSTTRRSVF